MLFGMMVKALRPGEKTLTGSMVGIVSPQTPTGHSWRLTKSSSTIMVAGEVSNHFCMCSSYANCDVGVPVVAIFTKFDGLVTTAFNELRKELNIKEAKNKRLGRAKEMLNTNFIGPLMATKFRPSDHVRLDG